MNVKGTTCQICQNLKQVTGPVVVCVGMRRGNDETDGLLDRNVLTLNLTEGLDLWYFV